jgi:SAM-dependent methyltransferase
MENSSDFFGQYAFWYDLLYQDKDYVSEASFVSDLIKKHCPKHGSARILDLACGTGRHAIELAQKGYEVEGSDISLKMVEMAKKAAKHAGLKIPFYTKSFQNANRIKKKFDVVLSMFSSINYLTTYREISLALKNIHGLLDDGGIFIFDFWNGNAVIEDFAPVRVKRMNKGTKSVLRYSENTIDRIAHTFNMKFNFILFNNDKIVGEFSENHVVRYFFLREMEDILDTSGFKVIYRCPFMFPEKELLYNDWNVTFVSRKS